MSALKEKLKNFFRANETKFILAVGLILVAGLSFEAGLIQGKNRQTSPVIVEKPVRIDNSSPEGAQGSPTEAQKLVQEAKISTVGQNIPGKICTFVGSKNSNKYHLPTCRYAKLIKPENTVCFSSAEDATAKGYLADKGCIK